jgi:hypothetical protein
LEKLVRFLLGVFYSSEGNRLNELLAEIPYGDKLLLPHKGKPGFHREEDFLSGYFLQIKTLGFEAGVVLLSDYENVFLRKYDGVKRLFFVLDPQIFELYNLHRFIN